MKIVKTVFTYILAGAGMAIGCKAVEKGYETLRDPYERNVLKNKIRSFTYKIKNRMSH